MLIPFGLKNGKIHHVKNVLNGLACDCICPSCGKQLIAKNKGQKKRPHFAHAIETDCFDYEAMTYLHQYAQQLLESEQCIVLPEFTYTPEIILLDDTVLIGEEIKSQQQRFGLILCKTNILGTSIELIAMEG
ncbi:competence protein CoiA family protein [Vibrio splendidus]